MQIRPATEADLDAVLGLIRALADYEKLPAPSPAAQDRLRRDAFAPQPRLELWVAEEDGRILAYAALFSTYSTFLARPSLYLEDLFVHPDARRRGIGTAMMRRLMELARERGCGRFEWLVLDWNTDAQAFYRGLGAEVMQEWRVVRMVLEPS